MTRRAPDPERWIKRAVMAVIGLYLVVSLALPLGVMLSKSLVTYQFDLTQFEFRVSDEAGNFGPPVLASDLAERLGRPDPAATTAGRDGRIQATNLFPEFSFRSPVRYRLRGTTPDARWYAGSDPQASTLWQEYDSGSFRRVGLGPVQSRGLANYRAYFATPALVRAIGNSVTVAAVSTALTLLLAFGFAHALARSRVRFKPLFRGIAFLPILVPSLLPGIALIYLFGNQGFLKPLLFGQTVYGPLGIVIGSVFFTFPHAFLIVSTALSIADQRHYDAAESLRASPWRRFRTVTLPGARHGLVPAGFVVFTLVITDFGLPKVIGGQYDLLALEIYRQVIGQQDFEMGAAVSVILLIPALLAFGLERRVQGRRAPLLTGESVPYRPKPDRTRDALALFWCVLVAGFILAIILVCQFAALVRFWPYDLGLTLRNYDFGMKDGGGWAAYGNSVRLALLTAVLGTPIIVTGAYVVGRFEGFRLWRGAVHLLAMLPMAVPGMVLGLSYIFFFNDPANPLHALYGTMSILVVATITHFYTVGHLTALTALRQIDPGFEPVAASLGQPFYRLAFRVTLPVCLHAVMDISVYLFVNAMTTVSAVVFLYSTHTALASVAVLNMDDAGEIAPAAAMGMMIFWTNAAARLLHMLAARGVLRRTQAWRASG